MMMMTSLIAGTIFQVVNDCRKLAKLSSPASLPSVHFFTFQCPFAMVLAIAQPLSFHFLTWPNNATQCSIAMVFADFILRLTFCRIRLCYCTAFL